MSFIFIFDIVWKVSLSLMLMRLISVIGEISIDVYGEKICKAFGYIFDHLGRVFDWISRYRDKMKTAKYWYADVEIAFGMAIMSGVVRIIFK